MEIFNPNNIGYTFLGYLTGTLITGSTIVIVLKCIFPRGIGAVRTGGNNHFRNGSSRNYGSGRRYYQSRNSFLPAGLFFLLAFLLLAFSGPKGKMENEVDSQTEWKKEQERKKARDYPWEWPGNEPERTGSSNTIRKENTYYASRLGTIPVINWRRQVERHAKAKIAYPAQYYIQKPASPNREVAREEAIDWAFYLGRPASLAFDPASPSYPYKVLLGPYPSREEAETDQRRLQTEGFVLDVSRKNWEIMLVQKN